LKSEDVRPGPDQDAQGTLEIEFQGGQVYQYFDVPVQVFEGLRNADSYGQYFNEHIKGYYRYARI